MTIWATPFEGEPLRCTQSSRDSGFETLDDVVVALGTPRKQTNAYVLYDGVIFSRLQWAVIDDNDNID